MGSVFVEMNQGKVLDKLRAFHKSISYVSHTYDIDHNHLNIEYVFEMHPDIRFTHHVSFSYFDLINISLREQGLDELVFNLGMVELISYYKLACPLEVKIHPYRLSQGEEAFWQKLFLKGLGEFIFVNKLDVKTIQDIQFTYANGAIDTQPFQCKTDPNKALIPVGGGKDSVVSLELSGALDDLDRYILMVNPIQAALRCSRVSGIDEQKYITVKRVIDPLLLDMNQQGFLNGHVPFSATIAFISLIASSLIQAEYIVLSNEASANQSNIQYMGMDINHQYSKSYEFESDFRHYVNDFISKYRFDYFSFLRLQSELEISALFAEMKKYHNVFLSCNQGGRADTWCASCPKCLFVAVMLLPFVPLAEVNKIFGKDVFGDLSLAELLDSLAGFGVYKPLECVGTFEEVQHALCLIQEKYSSSDVPLVYHFFSQHQDVHKYTAVQEKNENHFLPPQFLALIP